MAKGKLAKLTILSFQKPDFSDKDNNPYTVFINPEEYSREYKAVFTKKQGMNTSKNSSKYKYNPAEKISLKLYFDGTGVIPKSENIQKQIQKFKKKAYIYSGNIHQPRYLKLCWGALQFKCRLCSMTVKYLLFQPSGMPLRAEVSATFTEFIDQATTAKLDSRNSPDMTHVRTVKAGDTLPLMCYKIYGDCSYYLAVAKTNNMVNFAYLPVGQQITFPPIKK